MGLIYVTVVQCVCAMSSYLPVNGGLVTYAKRFVSDEVAFAMGINYWIGGAFKLCTEVSATAMVITYWTDRVDIALWISLILGFLFMLNMLPVSIYGQAEFLITSFKIAALIGLLILSIVVDAGGNPNHKRLGFEYWRNPGPLAEYLTTGHSGRLLGFMNSLLCAASAYGGPEIIAVAAAETYNPRRSIPLACKKVIMRILFTCTFGILAVGVLISYNDPDLLTAITYGLPGANGSPFTIALSHVGLQGLSHTLNVALLVSAFACCNAWMYASSRNLHALAVSRQAPALFAKTSRRGVPYCAVIATGAISLLSFLPRTHAVWISRCSDVSGLATWLGLLLTFLRFRKGAIVQGVYGQLLYFVTGAPYTVYIAMSVTFAVLVLQGLPSLLDPSDVLSRYIGLLLFVVPLIGWKFCTDSRVVGLTEMDLFTGKQEVDDHELDCVVIPPRTWYGKVWAVVA